MRREVVVEVEGLGGCGDDGQRNVTDVGAIVCACVCLY